MGTAGLHFHDLRHTGDTPGRADRSEHQDLMARMGHDMRAALICQRATSEIAELLSGLVDEHKSGTETTRPGDDQPDDGATGEPAPIR